MKNFLFIVPFLVCFTIFGQVQLYNTSLYQSNELIAYRNFSNNLELGGIAINSSTKIMKNNESLTRFDSIFVYAPMGNQTIDTLKVFQDEKLMGEFIMKVETLKTPKIYFGEYRSGEIKLDYILTNPGLHLSYEPQLLIPTFYVNACEMYISKNGKKESLEMVYGNAFSEKQIKKLSKLKSGDKIRFKTALLSDFQGGEDYWEADIQLTVAE